jgi:GAF domain-containing protein
MADPAPDTAHPDDPVFDAIAARTCESLRVPAALVSVVDHDRLVFVSARGLSEPWASRGETPLGWSFCQHVIGSGEPLLARDVREHPVLRHNPAIREIGAVAYAGVPIPCPAGRAVGALCVIDDAPRDWTDEDVHELEALAARVAAALAQRTTP